MGGGGGGITLGLGGDNGLGGVMELPWYPDSRAEHSIDISLSREGSLEMRERMILCVVAPAIYLPTYDSYGTNRMT